ncbi:hypothetical protein [Cryobacterium cryoconiti]|uniref:Uncharacterized protein n=1 Tax=Cryobacterium cryoconiti TaxID=1259239 RepID=A0A4Y8JV47_9MICO|nr:hypothetical protein [Cryobacterium cryoconiti]TFD31315.1 hypothetical protein E3T49_06305 [Cryobacterium cryoconiti]
MFGNAEAKPPTDAPDLSAGSVESLPEGGNAAESGSTAANSSAAANSETVGQWLEHLPTRSWDESPDE